MVNQMETFDSAFRERHGQKHDWIQRIDEGLGFVGAARAAEIDGYLLSPASTSPALVGELLHLGVYRVTELAESAIRELNRHRVVSGCLLARGAFETSCFVYELVRRVDALLKGKPKVRAEMLETLETFAKAGLYGSRSEELAAFKDFRAHNVLNHIQALSKKYDVPFDKCYDRLSEYCHPNANGMLLLYTTKHGAAVAHFTERNEEEADIAIAWCLAAMATALDMMEDSLRQWLDVRDQLAQVAEKVIFDRGTWPKDTPYPVTAEMREALRRAAELGEP